MRAVAVLLCLASMLFVGAFGRVDPKDCEVCNKVIGDIYGSLSKKDLKNKVKVERAIDKYCKKTKKEQHKKLCYTLQTIKRDVSTPLANLVPADRICKRLKKKSAEICSIRYPEKLDLSKVNLKSLRVKQLRKILSEQGISCDGCIEKSDFIREVEKALGRKDEL